MRSYRDYLIGELQNSDAGDSLEGMWPLEFVIYADEEILRALEKRAEVDPKDARLSAAIEITEEEIRNR